jgi:hypothetical protein
VERTPRAGRYGWPQNWTAKFSGLKQNRPPDLSVREPVLAKRGSYFGHSKARAKNDTAFGFLKK